ncbi:siderophore-iron reductase FhuF [Halopseudomonas nanhaiensis]|uniref:siderophore-iron reductase FhuF n=1 Tax=Halopseudomonas nanhaiensis TaxID=2830842 RepID=UPI001CBC9072|nr:siderophore-iron reductase FhuF [Halopseudomonas nanhaiensis]UAW98442.1 siderophore-iron reductase FhuF [Halopseudomonas nanhaiensis]
MTQTLQNLFPGPLARLSDTLALPGDPRPSLGISDYLAPEQLADNLLRFAPQYAQADRRALVSIWIKYHFLRLVPAVVAASVMHDWRLPVHTASLRVAVGADGLPEAFILPDLGSAWNRQPRNGFERFEELMDGHLDPVIRTLCGQVKIAPKVLWSSVGHYYEWMLGELAHAGAPQDRIAQARELLQATCRPNGYTNPLYDSIRYVERPDADAPHRQRKHCCVRYLLPGKTLCATCPHTDNPPAGYQPDAILIQQA